MPPVPTGGRCDMGGSKEVRMKVSLIVLIMGVFAIGCAASSDRPSSERTLRAPAGTTPQAVAAVEEGNRLFASQQWEAAKVQYEAAIKAQPSLAEAHYNLAMSLEKLGDKAAAKKHYIEAADLAPGNKVIWNAPPLRRHGEVGSVFKKEDSFIDAKPR
jgi:Tfp pilus assembly protein PilF